MRLLVSIVSFMALLLGTPAMAWAQGAPEPKGGPVFTDFGQVYAVDPDVPVPKDAVFKLFFEISEGAAPGTINTKVNSAGRFINMHVAAGVPAENIHIALVVHGTAGMDLLKDAAYRARNGGKPNASAAAVSQLLAHGVDIYLCGQSAAGRNYPGKDLIPGVKVSLSAMTMYALLQQQGYTFNPS